MCYLEQVNSPQDVKNLTQEQLKQLCDEIRSFLIEKVSVTGGHLSSNLGTVELTVALHRVFTTPQDVIVFDVDVLGGINLKKIFGDDACSIFVQPPSIEELERRLRGRATDSEEVIAKRVAKAEFELSKASEFDHVVVNDDLDTAVNKTIAIINDFLN